MARGGGDRELFGCWFTARVVWRVSLRLRLFRVCVVGVCAVGVCSWCVVCVFGGRVGGLWLGPCGWYRRAVSAVGRALIWQLMRINERPPQHSKRDLGRIRLVVCTPHLATPCKDSRQNAERS